MKNLRARSAPPSSSPSIGGVYAALAVAALCALAAPACSESGLHGATDDELGPGAVGPRIQVEPAALELRAGVACSVEASVRVTNIGTERLRVEAPALGGLDVAVFGMDPVDAFVLDPGASYDLLIGFTAPEEGERTASLHLESSDPTRPEVDVPVLGVGDNGERIRTDDFSRTEHSGVDVLFVIDNSSSMGQEQAQVAANIAGFFGWFLDLGLDYHMGVITTDVVNPEHSGRLQGDPGWIDEGVLDAPERLARAVEVGDQDMGNESGLAALELALSEPVLSGDNAGFYRDDAFLSVILVSDEPEQSAEGSAHYIDFLAGLKADPDLISVSAIVGDRGEGCGGVCDGVATAAQPGDKYIDVQEAFPGIFQTICACDYSASMEAVGLASAGIRSVFPLTRVPSDPTRIEVEIDGTLTVLWHYDATANAVELEPEAIPDRLVPIFISYPIEGGCED